MLCRTLGFSLVVVVVCATSLTAEDAASPAEDSLNAAVQEYLQLAADGKWEQADAMLEELAHEHPDDPAVQLMHEHAQLRRKAFPDAMPMDAANWRVLCEFRMRAKDLEASRRSLQEALEQRIDVDFDNATLESAMRHFATTCGINVVVDEPGLVEVGVTPYSKLNLRVTNVRLATILDLILEPLNLGYVVEDEVLKISSQARLAGPMTTIVYSIADLVQGRLHWDENVSEELERIAMLVQETIDPDSWSGVGGHGHLDVHEGTIALVIRQTPGVHAEIGDLFAGLRRELDVSISNNVSVLDLSRDEAMRLGLGVDSDPIVMDVEETDAWWEMGRISRRSEAGAVSMKQVVQNAQTGRFEAGPAERVSSYLLNAQVSTDRRSIVVRLANPESFAAGDVMAAAQSARVPDGETVIFVLARDLGTHNDDRIRVCIVKPSIQIAEEEEELLGTAD